MKFISLKIGLAFALWLVVALPAGALKGVVVIANKGVPVSSLSTAALKDIYTGKTTYWEDGQSVVIVVLAGKNEDATLNEVSGMDTGQFKTFWQRMVFSGRGQEPKKANDTASLVAFIAATRGAIGIVSADAELKDVIVLQIK